ncbi:hypothetical protein C1646_751154 [Rhizophagus diaphanus]|nr:hypothetical protein C1646_751154 [Rhizophagus diaphanus] [Rhizophagus sp. MUCL 43196]
MTMSASMFYPSDEDSDEDSYITHSTQSSKIRKNMIAHLRDKHGITKDNFTNYLDEYREPKWDQSYQTQVTDYYSSSKPYNGANMVKGILLLNTNHISSIERQPCATYTLQLSVQKGLKQCKVIYHHVKNLQVFFQFSKQAQHLHEAQKEQNESNQAEEDVQSPLDLLTDVKMRHLCGANYPTLNLVHPYMESLKKKFAPRSD